MPFGITTEVDVIYNKIRHLADYFIQSDLVVPTFYVCVAQGIEPTTLAMQVPCSTN